MPNRVIIAGSRSLNGGYKLVKEAVSEFDLDIDVIVSGGARGIDEAGEKFGKKEAIPVQICPADWDKHGKGAGFIRNKDMAKYADALIAIWDGESNGTKHMIETAHNHGLPVLVYKPHSNEFKRSYE